MRWLCLALLGCGAVDISTEQLPCENVSFDAEPTVEISPDGDDVLVYRTPVFVGDMDSFEPELEFDGRTVFVREAWTDSEESTDEVCRNPTVRFVRPPSGEFAVEWYLSESVIPDFRVRFKASDFD